MRLYVKKCPYSFNSLFLPTPTYTCILCLTEHTCVFNREKKKPLPDASVLSPLFSCRLLCCVPLSLPQTLLLGPPPSPADSSVVSPLSSLQTPLSSPDSSGSSSSLGKSKGIDVRLQRAFYSLTSLVMGDSGGLIHIR